MFDLETFANFVKYSKCVKKLNIVFLCQKLNFVQSHKEIKLLVYPLWLYIQFEGDCNMMREFYDLSVILNFIHLV